MGPDVGSKVIGIAKTMLGSHYINGGYGATPGREDGCPCRPGGIKLIADPNRLDPNVIRPAEKSLAVLAAEMSVKTYCVCAGNYASQGGRDAVASDREMLDYLASLKSKQPNQWTPHQTGLTPRRAYGPGQGGGDSGGKLVWAKPCTGVRHFDCVGFISFCIWKATGSVIQLDIAAWRKPNQVGTVHYLRAHTETDKEGNKKEIAANPPAALQDGDIIVKADHHIAFVTAGGVIYEAQDTHIGVTASPGFNQKSPGTWTHLVRMGNPQAPTEAPAWPLGWWRIWDGNTYYYYFAADNSVKYTKTVPTNTRTAPSAKIVINVGTYVIKPPNTLIVTWNKRPGVSQNCVETFYNAAPDCEEMNAKSNLYGPLGAKRLQ